MTVKKIILIAMMAGWCGAMSAQQLTEGNLAALCGQKVINCDFDFSDPEIGRLSLAEFVEYKDAGGDRGDFEKDFAEGQDECNWHFINNANEKLRDFRLGRNQDTEIDLTVKLLTIDEDGRDNVCDYIFTRAATGEKVAVVRMKAKGGRFGTFTNLMGDAFKSAGEKFGRYLNREVRKECRAIKDSNRINH